MLSMSSLRSQQKSLSTRYGRQQARRLVGEERVISEAKASPARTRLKVLQNWTGRGRHCHVPFPTPSSLLNHRCNLAKGILSLMTVLSPGCYESLANKTTYASCGPVLSSPRAIDLDLQDMNLLKRRAKCPSKQRQAGLLGVLH